MGLCYPEQVCVEVRTRRSPSRRLDSPYSTTGGWYCCCPISLDPTTPTGSMAYQDLHPLLSLYCLNTVMFEYWIGRTKSISSQPFDEWRHPLQKSAPLLLVNSRSKDETLVLPNCYQLSLCLAYFDGRSLMNLADRNQHSQMDCKDRPFRVLTINY